MRAPMMSSQCAGMLYRRALKLKPAVAQLTPGTGYLELDRGQAEKNLFDLILDS